MAAAVTRVEGVLTERSRIRAGAVATLPHVIVLLLAASAGVLLIRIDRPWLTDAWTWTLPVSIAIVVLAGLFLKARWALLVPVALMIGQHVTYSIGQRASTDPRAVHTDVGLYWLYEVVLFAGLMLIAWLTAAVRVAINAARGKDTAPADETRS